MSQNKSDGTIYVQLGSYLQQLRIIESRKSENDRLHIPTVKELAEVAGVHPNSISRIVNGYTKRLNLDIAGAILVHMRRCGFQLEISDILGINLPEDLDEKKNEILPRRLPPPLTRRQRLKYPGDEFVKAYAEGSEGETSFAYANPKQPEMLPEVTEVMRMLTSFPESIQKGAALNLKGQLELVQKTLSFDDQ